MTAAMPSAAMPLASLRTARRWRDPQPSLLLKALGIGLDDPRFVRLKQSLWQGDPLADAVAALALAGARHLQDGAPIRLTGEGIRAMRCVLASYAEQLETLSARTMTECHRLTERRVHDILRGVRRAHDVEVVAL